MALQPTVKEQNDIKYWEMEARYWEAATESLVKFCRHYAAFNGDTRQWEIN